MGPSLGLTETYLLLWSVPLKQQRLAYKVQDNLAIMAHLNLNLGVLWTSSIHQFIILILI